MTGFFLKKCFCDGWDNILALVAYNLLCLVLIVGAWFFALQLKTFAILAVLGVAVCVVLLFMILLAVNQTTAKFAAFKYVSVKETLVEVFAKWKEALVLTGICIVLVYMVKGGLPFYFGMYRESGNIFSLFLASVLFWFLVVTVLSLQWYFPIRAQLNNGIVKSLKKCFMLFFDNSLFSVFMFVYALFLLGLSFFLAFMVPGFSGILLAWNNAFRLRLYKYDWIEAHPELSPKAARKQIPWDELLAEDRETLGPRTLRSFIFPWKD